MILDSDMLTRLEPLEFKARRIVEGFISGLHTSPHHGFSVEFAEHRPYNSGDELRHLDWKVYGKTERFYVRRYVEETNLRTYLLLDTSSSMYFRHFAGWSKLRYGVHLVAALIHLLHRQRDAAGLVTFDHTIREQFPAKTSPSHLHRLYAHLDGLLESESSASIEKRTSASAELLHELAETFEKRSLVVIVSDLFDPSGEVDKLIEALKHLRHRDHEVLLFHLLEHRSERELDFPEGRYLFEDMETGEELELTPAEVMESYRRLLSDHIRQFGLACSEANIDYEEIDTRGPFDRALFSWLGKRKRIR